MADITKVRRNNLPVPPPVAEVRENLTQPELAPAAVDGRTLRATGRTKQFATRVSEEWYKEVRLYAANHGLKLVEVLERAMAALKEKAP